MGFRWDASGANKENAKAVKNPKTSPSIVRVVAENCQVLGHVIGMPFVPLVQISPSCLLSSGFLKH